MKKKNDKNYLDKIPVSAAVNESVKLSKKMSASYSSGLINAVLRKIASNGIKLPPSLKNIYKELYVSENGSDEGAGDVSSPFKTISKTPLSNLLIGWLDISQLLKSPVKYILSAAGAHSL